MRSRPSQRAVDSDEIIVVGGNRVTVQVCGVIRKGPALEKLRKEKYLNGQGKTKKLLALPGCTINAYFIIIMLMY